MRIYKFYNEKKYTYLFKKGDNLNAGVIAQEVEKVLPFAVSTDEKNIKSVNYICLIPARAVISVAFFKHL